jgi:Ca2+-binding RTX toxin-like protein
MANVTATNSNTLLSGTSSADSLTAAGFSGVTLVGNGGADTFNGGPSGSLVGGAGNDSFFDTVTGGGYATMVGSTGTNTYNVNSTTDTILDSGTNSVIRSSVGFDLSSSLVSGVNHLVYTSSLGASLTGTTSANSITGGSGNDTLSDGGGGNDTLIGGGGRNTYLVSTTGVRIQSSAVAGSQDTVLGSQIITSANNYSLASNLAGGVHVLTYDSVLGAGSTSLIGSTGADTISANGVDQMTLLGGGGADSLLGYSNGTLVGGSANDTLNDGGGSGVFLNGAGGTNTYYVNNVTDTLSDNGAGSVIYSSVGLDLSQATQFQGGKLHILNYTSSSGASLKGTALSDTIVGNSGDDTLDDGGLGLGDSLVGGAGRNAYFINNSGSVVNDNGGSGSIIYSSDNYDLSSTTVNTLVFNGAGYGLSLLGNASSNSIVGGSGDDTLSDGGGGTDTLRGGDGANTYLVSNATDYIVDNGSNSIVVTPFSTNLASSTSRISGVNHVEFTGTGGYLSGNNKGDSLIANGGNNTLYGAWKGSGKASTLIGGGDNNAYVIVYNWDTIIDSGSGGVIYSPGSYNLNSSLVSGVNNLVHSGSKYVAKLVGNSNAGSLIANASNDTLVGGGLNTLIGTSSLNNYTYVVNSTTDTILDSGTNSVIRSAGDYDLSSSLAGGVHFLVHTGTAGASLKSGAGADSIFSGYANDTLIDGGGADTLNGHGGTNTYIVSNANDRIIDTGRASQILTSLTNYSLGSSLVSGVRNLVYTGVAAATLSGSTGADSILGGAGADSISGGDGNDTFNGGGGSDTINGGSGFNTYIVSGNGNLIVDTGRGSVVRSSGSFDLGSSLVSGVNNLVYTGAGGATLSGSSGADSILGGAGADSISGGAGNDILQGWSGTASLHSGSDTLTGGTGADRFILSVKGQATNAYGNGSGAVASITDFQGGSTGDKLVLHDFGIGHAGSAGYQTLSGGGGILDVYTYQGTDANNLVAHMTLASGSFSWTSNATFV